MAAAEAAPPRGTQLKALHPPDPCPSPATLQDTPYEKEMSRWFGYSLAGIGLTTITVGASEASAVSALPCPALPISSAAGLSVEPRWQTLTPACRAPLLGGLC